MATIASTVSVIITCYSEGELLLEAVSSVQDQTVQPLEIVIVNDASTDPKTIEACQQLEANSQIRLVWRQQNGGPSAARNDGFQNARGSIFIPLDADDVLPTNAIELISQAFNTHPAAGFVYGKYCRQNYSEDSTIIEPEDISLKRMLSPRQFSLSSQWSLIGTTPLRRSLWEAVGEYDSTFGREDLHDVEFWIRAISHPSFEHYYIPEVIYVWRKYLGSNSSKVTPLSWYRIAKKYFDIYCQNDLEYRAYELLLLGSKWLNQSNEIQQYSNALVRCIRENKVRFSSLVILLIPTFFLRLLVTYAVQRR
jgi:glycosyltransferase involved in cell wall biosynthesis